MVPDDNRFLPAFLVEDASPPFSPAGGGERDGDLDPGEGASLPGFHMCSGWGLVAGGRDERVWYWLVLEKIVPAAERERPVGGLGGGKHSSESSQSSGSA